MNQQIEQNLIERWKELLAKRALADHELAEHAWEMRRHHASGAAGDDAFRVWLATKIGTVGMAGQTVLAWARAWDAVRDAKEFVALGGIASAKFLSRLTAKQRMAVLQEARAKIAERGGRPITATTVREIALRLGFAERQPRAPTDHAVRLRLTEYINRCHVAGKLLPLPDDVRALVRPKRHRATAKAA